MIFSTDGSQELFGKTLVIDVARHSAVYLFFTSQFCDQIRDSEVTRLIIDGEGGVTAIIHDASADMVDEYRSKEYPSGTCVTEFEESVLHEEYMFAIHLNDEKHQETNMSSLLHTTREHEMGQVKLEPSEYYFHVMHDFRELSRLAIPASGIVVFRSDTGKYKKFRSECDEFLKLVATRLDLLRKMESLDL
ncbi:hypothetical protein Tco_0830713 [Tanacetum coccineum]